MEVIKTEMFLAIVLWNIELEFNFMSIFGCMGSVVWDGEEIKMSIIDVIRNSVIKKKLHD